jgi:hypothetical protein
MPAIGYRFEIGIDGLRRRGERTLPAFHIAEILDASIRGLAAEQLFRGEKSLHVLPHRSVTLVADRL